MTIIQSLAKVIPIILWFILCGLGGFWITRSLFNLKPNEELFAGAAIGLVISTFLVNIFGRFMLFADACWVSALLILITGMLLSFIENRHDLRKSLLIHLQPVVLISFLCLTLLFLGIGNGLSILDEFQTLPLISQMAAGDLPLHFPLDPKLVYNYHYFPYLLSAQLMKVGDLFPWTALDLQHALFASLSIFLLGFWVYRITNNRFASIGAGIFYFLSGGTRWFLLFLPQSVLKTLDANLSRIGSGLNSGTTLQSALTSAWAAQGTGPFTIPFSFANGFNAPNSIGLGYVNLPLLFLALFLLTFNHWKNWKSIFIYIILLSSLALSHEITFVFLLIGTLTICIILSIQQKRVHIPRELVFLIIALFVSGIISIFQGGVISGLFSQWWIQNQATSATNASYHSFSFSLANPPAFVDAHLGVLSIFNPIHLFVWLIETGPMILLLLLAAPWGIKKYQEKKWMEAILAVLIVFSMLLIFIGMDFKSGSIGALARAQDYFLFIFKIIAIPILIIWLPGRNETIKLVAYSLIGITLFGGLIIFGLQLPAIQEPVLSTYIKPLDAKIMKEFWNKLDPSYMVFDPEPMRSAVIFGHASDVGSDWYTYRPEWIDFFNNPYPAAMVKAKFGYLYTDQNYIHSLPQVVQDGLNNPCVVKQADVTDDFGGQRILLDLRACR